MVAKCKFVEMQQYQKRAALNEPLLSTFVQNFCFSCGILQRQRFRMSETCSALAVFNVDVGADLNFEEINPKMQPQLLKICQRKCGP